MAGEPIPVEGEPGGPVTVSVEAWDKYTDEWALAIGRFIVAFAACEWWTHDLIQAFGTRHVADVCDDFQLGTRIGMAEAVIRDLGLPKELQARADDAFKKLRDLVGPRNLVAHNPPMIVVSFDDKGARQVGQDIVSIRNARKDMTIPRLQEHHVQAVELDNTIVELEAKIRQWRKAQKP